MLKKLSIKTLFIALCVFASFVSLTLFDEGAFGGQAPSLCESGEQVFFSCRTNSRDRIVSVCGSANLTKSTGYLAYRFGKKGQVELEFRSNPATGHKEFGYAHYFRARVEETEISFKKDGYVYTVFDNYQGDTGKPVSEKGVSVSKTGVNAQEQTISCKGPVISNLGKLEGIVPCDPENPLNMDSCPGK